MKVVVITGSTRGIGFGLAKALLERGCQVVVSGRQDDSVRAAVDQLSAVAGPSPVTGYACDVRRQAALQALWEHASQQFGQVDTWVNNAGISNRPEQVWKIAAEEIETILDTNLLGSMLATKVAIHGMLEQRHGAIYIMEGMGSDGRMHSGLTPYGMTKYALDYYFKALVEELNDTPIIVGAIRPGMVVTDLITEPYRGKPEEWARVKPIFNIIADPLEPVSNWMAQAILENRQHGKVLNRVSRIAMMARFLKAPFTQRDLFAEIDLSK